jgi:hypothetical protein
MNQALAQSQGWCEPHLALSSLGLGMNFCWDVMNHPNCGDLKNQCWEGVLITLQQIGPVWASSLLTPHVAFWAVGSSGYLARTHFRHPS